MPDVKSNFIKRIISLALYFIGLWMMVMATVYAFRLFFSDIELGKTEVFIITVAWLIASGFVVLLFLINEPDSEDKKEKR